MTTETKKYITRNFPKADLRELVCFNVGEEAFDGYQVIENEIEDTSRWSIHKSLTFKFEDKFYTVGYSEGATESQDESPFEHEPDEIECTEVEPVEVVKITYKSKEAV